MSSCRLLLIAPQLSFPTSRFSCSAVFAGEVASPAGSPVFLAAGLVIKVILVGLLHLVAELLDVLVIFIEPVSVFRLHKTEGYVLRHCRQPLGRPSKPSCFCSILDRDSWRLRSSAYMLGIRRAVFSFPEGLVEKKFDSQGSDYRFCYQHRFKEHLIYLS